MKMSIPVFLLFSIYGVVNTYLPLFLRTMGYSASTVGFLLAVFEISGLVIPFLLSPLISKKGIYGIFLLFRSFYRYNSLSLLKTTGFLFTALFLAIYAAGFKGIVPVSDSLINKLLGVNRADYGRVRVMGSIGFVVMSLTLQFFARLESAKPDTIIIWMISPSLLFALSIIVIPGLIKRHKDDEPGASPELDSRTKVNKTDRSSVPLLKRVKLAIQEFPPVYWAGLLLMFAGFLGMTPANRFFSMYVYEYLGMEASGFLWALAAAAEIPFMFFSSRFLRRFGSMKLIILGTFAIFLRVIPTSSFPI